MTNNRTPSQIARIAAAALTVAVGLAAVAGCERPADETTRRDITEALALRAAGDPERGYEQTAQAAAAAQSPDDTAALAGEFAGDVGVESAEIAFAGEPAAEGVDPATTAGLGQSAAQALDLAAQATQLANAVALAEVFVAGQQLSDPQPTTALIGEKVNAVRSASDGWSASPEAQDKLQSIAQTEAQIERISAELSQLQAQQADLEQRRSAKSREAAQAEESGAEQLDGGPVELVRRVAELRKEAGDLGAEQLPVAAKIRLAEADLAEQQALLEELRGAVTALEAQSQTLSESWQQVRGQIDALRQAGEATYGGEAPSVESLSQRLADAVARVEDRRSRAAEALDAADAAYGRASQSATAAAAGQRPENIFSRPSRDLYDTGRLNLKRAAAKRQLGLVQTEAALVYSAVLRLGEALGAANRALPASLPGDARARYDEAVQLAAEAYAEANETATNVVESGQGPRRDAAVAQKAATVQGMLSLQSILEMTPGEAPQTSLPSRAELQQQVQQVVDAARGTSATLPRTAAFAVALLQGAGGGESPAPSQPEAVPEAVPDAQPEGGEPSVEIEPAGDPGAQAETEPGDPTNPDAVGGGGEEPPQ